MTSAAKHRERNNDELEFDTNLRDKQLIIYISHDLTPSSQELFQSNAKHFQLRMNECLFKRIEHASVLNKRYNYVIK